MTRESLDKGGFEQQQRAGKSAFGRELPLRPLSEAFGLLFCHSGLVFEAESRCSDTPSTWVRLSRVIGVVPGTDSTALPAH
jgi:hypothetical protein